MKSRSDSVPVYFGPDTYSRDGMCQTVAVTVHINGVEVSLTITQQPELCNRLIGAKLTISERTSSK